MPRRLKAVPTDRKALERALAKAAKNVRTYNRRARAAVQIAGRWHKRVGQLRARLEALGPDPEQVAQQRSAKRPTGKLRSITLEEPTS